VTVVLGMTSLNVFLVIFRYKWQYLYCWHTKALEKTRSADTDLDRNDLWPHILGLTAA